MPIYDHSYRPWTGLRTPLGTRWWTITRTELKNLSKRREFWFISFVSLVVFVVHIIIIYANLYTPQQLVRIIPEWFMDFIRIETAICYLMAALCGSGLISNDIQHKVLPIYFAKPLSQSGYIIGKGTVLFIVLTCMTFVPANLLLLIYLGGTKDFKMITDHLWLPASISAYSLAVVFLITNVTCAISALNRSARWAAVSFFAFILLGSAGMGLIGEVFDSDYPACLAVPWNLIQLGEVMFFTKSFVANKFWIVLCWLLLNIGSIAIMFRRVRAVEIVK